MKKTAVIDSGPLIALFNRDDKYHQQAIQFIKQFKGELLTNFSVITEVSHLLDFSANAQIKFLKWIISGGVTIIEIFPEDLDRIIKLIEKYADLPMDFTDASLVVYCEREKIRTVVSLDKDFTIYRVYRNKPLQNLFFS